MDIRLISFRTLTPLWSGGADKKCSQGLLETSILGSLRWWLEALARGYGIPVPDPTDDPSDDLPPSCVDRIFGHTGRKRRFRIEINPASVGEVRIESKINLVSLSRPGMASWFFPGGTAFVGGQTGDGQPEIRGRLILTPVAPDPKEVDPVPALDIVEGLLSFVSRWGALGAKAQHGFGIVDYRSDTGVAALRKWLAQESAPAAISADLPSVARFFSVRLVVKEPCRLGPWKQRQECTLRLRQLLRAELHGRGFDDGFRHRVMGWVDSNPASRDDARRGSRIFTSLPYQDGNDQVIRLWGWDSDVDRVVRSIEPVLREYGRSFSMQPSRNYGQQAHVEALFNGVAQ